MFFINFLDYEKKNRKHYFLFLKIWEKQKYQYLIHIVLVFPFFDQLLSSQRLAIDGLGLKALELFYLFLFARTHRQQKSQILRLSLFVFGSPPKKKCFYRYFYSSTQKQQTIKSGELMYSQKALFSIPALGSGSFFLFFFFRFGLAMKL